LSKGKIVRDAAVSKFPLPAFEGATGPPFDRRPDRRGSRLPERTPEDIEREARLRGFEAGEKAGIENVEREAARLLAGLRNAVGQAEALREQIAREAEPQVVDLAVAIARRIVIGELSLAPERIAAIVKEAIRRIERSGPVTLKVHPDLFGLIAGLKADLAESQTEILLDVDPSVPPSGPIVTAATEEVLTDVDEQIRVIVEEMRSARAAR